MTEQQTEILYPIFKSLSVQKIKTETEQINHNKNLIASFERVKAMKASETLAFIDFILSKLAIKFLL